MLAITDQNRQQTADNNRLKEWVKLGETYYTKRYLGVREQETFRVKKQEISE